MPYGPGVAVRGQRDSTFTKIVGGVPVLTCSYDAGVVQETLTKDVIDVNGVYTPPRGVGTKQTPPAADAWS